ncbi:sugar kinase [Treponema sp. OttesenSCG-928-L16]|nr:sugar kinase [Treponema sp. OttesenSCG-928-L16]
MKSTVTSFGEILIRMDSPDNFRFRQTYPGWIRTSFAGSEANVAASVSILGGHSRFVTALPESPLSDACIRFLESSRINTDCIVKCDTGRLGIYFVETGANQRGSNVVYDRDGTAISLAKVDAYDWNCAFKDSAWFHVSGITPSLSEISAETSLFAVQKAKEMGLKVSCDLNFRKKLWNWEPGTPAQELARKIISKMIPYIDVLIGNEEDAELMLGFKAGRSNAEAGYLDIKSYSDLCRRIASAYPNLTHIAFTLRESISATYNRWGGILFDVKSDTAHFAPQDKKGYKAYEITSIVDRVGAGDSFAGSLIYALNGSEYAEPEQAIAFAAAASCLAHSIRGDFNFVAREDVLKLIKDGGSGRVNR